MKIHILGRNALNCALYLEFNEIFLLNKIFIRVIALLFKGKLSCSLFSWHV